MKEHELYNTIERHKAGLPPFRNKNKYRPVGRDVRMAQVIGWGLIIVGVVTSIYGILEHL